MYDDQKPRAVRATAEEGLAQPRARVDLETGVGGLGRERARTGENLPLRNEGGLTTLWRGHLEHTSTSQRVGSLPGPTQLE